MIRVGIIGAGWPGQAHAKGYLAAGGFKLVAAADLIPDRRRKLLAEAGIQREYASAEDLLKDKEIDAVSVCVPTHLHVPVTLAALKSIKHVICETPPALSAADAKRLAKAAEKYNRTLLFSLQRRFGPHEQAARQAILKGFAGDVYHARAAWTRTRGIPLGTGWYTKKETAGGGALADLGLHMLDLAWFLLGQPNPESAYAVTHQKFGPAIVPQEVGFDVDDAAFAIVRFEGGKSLELSASWALNQPPSQNGTLCRVYGPTAAIDVYTPQGPVAYTNFDAKGNSKAVPIKPPKVAGYPALMRHFRDCIQGKATPTTGPTQAVVLMQMLDALYKSAGSGKSVNIS
jgi:predicted dehydrogenase